MTTAIETVKTDTLDTLRSRAETLTERAAKLTAQVEKAREREQDLAEHLALAQAALMDGGGAVEAVRRATRDLQEARAVLADLEQALAQVQESEAAALAEVQTVERKQERRRQERAAEPLRAETEALAEAFVKGLAGVTEPLRRRREIADRLAQDLPLAAPLKPLAVMDLARGLVGALSESGTRAPVADAEVLVAAFLRRVLAGPYAAPYQGILRVVPPETCSDLLVKE